MSRKYYVWKNPDCNGKDIEWCEITGKQFNELVKMPENANRRFIKFNNDICNEADVIIMECTRIQYKEWCHEIRSHRYLAPYTREREFVSIDHKFGPDELVLNEIIADGSIDVQEDVECKAMLELLKSALLTLTEEERDLLNLLYFANISGKSEREIADKLGLHKNTLNSKKEKIFKKLKKSFGQNRFSWLMEK